MDEDPQLVLSSTVSDINNLRNDIVNISSVLRACDFQDVDDDATSTVVIPTSLIPRELYSYKKISETFSSYDSVISDLKIIRNRVSVTSDAFASYSEQLKTTLSCLNTFSEISKSTQFEKTCQSFVQTEDDFYHLLNQLAKGLQSGLFFNVRELSTFSLNKILSEFIDQYNELNIKYNELLAMSSQIPIKQLGCTYLDQTAVFEMLEKEISNSAKEVEQVRSSFESRLNAITADWECERSKLMTDLHKKEVTVEKLQQVVEEKETAYLKLKGDLDELARRFCSKENIPVDQNASLYQVKSFLMKLEKKCSWIWDVLYENCNEVTHSILPNPIDQMFEKSSKLQERVSHYRELVNKLCNPKVATAFANNVRQNLSSNKLVDVQCTTSSSGTTSTPIMNSTINNNLTASVQSEQENSLTTVSTLLLSKASPRKSSETSSSSILSRVGAAVTAIANVITSPKRLQQSPEYSSENKRSRPSATAAEPRVSGKHEEKPVFYDSIPSKIAHPVLSTKSNNIILPDKPITSSTTPQDGIGLVRHSSTRKPLTELSGPKVKSPTKSDHFLSPFSSTSQSRKEYFDKNYSKPITNSHFLHPKKLDPLPQDILRSIHANIGKDLNVNRRPPEFINRLTTSQSPNEKDDLFITSASKPLNPSWQVPKQEPLKQKPSSEAHNINTLFGNSNDPPNTVDRKKQDEPYSATSINQKVQRNPSAVTFHKKPTNVTPQECNPS
ncbi:Epa2p-like protein [Schistosoma japonicum]|nr:Epa2p-like protein [Schistosoma japonicum]KAH8850327.1 Epa2p-like protein [Schistosoma japonicum]